ncbi:hypothetical protein LPJ56_000685 [Coemansia sp. RSA 2599]|nr:hypothetical protein LPJ75_000335 [Coemansia sp. RSA 2598]KAJ1829051.1 hypothetical protein LPJ56_000685 [Coemansia sp. RSA 2599]
MLHHASSSAHRRRNKSRHRQDDFMDMQEFDWARSSDWGAYRGAWQTASPDIASSTAATPTARGEDIGLSGMCDLKTQLLERLDEQWLVIQQLSQCVQDTNRQLSMLTFFMQQHSVYDSIHGGDSAGYHRQPARAAAQRPLRFNPGMGDRGGGGGGFAEAGDVGQKIALRMPLGMGESFGAMQEQVQSQEQMQEQMQAQSLSQHQAHTQSQSHALAQARTPAKISKKRSGLLSIRDIVNTSEQQAAASREPEAAEQTKETPRPQQAEQTVLVPLITAQTAPPPPAPILPPLSMVSDCSDTVARDSAGPCGVSSHAETYRAPTRERRVPATPLAPARAKKELEPERRDAASSHRAGEALCPTCSMCQGAAAAAAAVEPALKAGSGSGANAHGAAAHGSGTESAPVSVPAPASVRPAMSVMEMARMFDKRNRAQG